VTETLDFNFPMVMSMVRNLNFHIGLCSVMEYWHELIPMIQNGKLHPERMITHEMSLSDGAEAYRMFNARENGVIKTTLTP
jgi:threonine dehydrogenase-like Zn-dependent dehydrogenase